MNECDPAILPASKTAVVAAFPIKSPFISSKTTLPVQEN